MITAEKKKHLEGGANEVQGNFLHQTTTTGKEPVSGFGYKGTAEEKELQKNALQKSVFGKIIKAITFDSSINAIQKTSELALAIADKVKVVCGKKDLHIMTADNIMLEYDGTKWSQVIPTWAKHQAMPDVATKAGVYPNRATTNLCEKIFEQIVAKFDVGKFPTPSANKINLQNGTLNIATGDLEKHKATDYFRYVLPYEYDPMADCPMWQKFLDEVLPEKESQKVLQEYFGYILTKGWKMEKCLFLYGSGANGKSVALEVLCEMLGKENVSHIDLADLCTPSSYSLIEIEGKLANICNDADEKITKSSTFKTLVSQEPIMARAIYKDPHVMTDYGKLVFSLNALPKCNDRSQGYFRRALIIPFDVTIPKEKRDKYLAQKIIDQELSGVLNWALEGLDRLKAKQDFTDAPAIAAIIERFIQESDDVRAFIDSDSVEKKVYGFSNLYQLFIDYCRENGLNVLSKKAFGMRLQDIDGVIPKNGNKHNYTVTIK